MHLMRTVDDYEQRLVQRVREWESKNPADAERVRIETRRKIGMLTAPPDGSIRWMVVERAYRENVRKERGWPTAAEWVHADHGDAA